MNSAPVCTQQKRTPAAELSPALRSRLLCAMLEQQQSVRAELQLRRQLSTTLQPALPEQNMLGMLKVRMQRESRRLHRNRRSGVVWQRCLLLTGATVAVLLAVGVVVNLWQSTPSAQQQLGLTAPAPITFSSPCLQSARGQQDVLAPYDMEPSAQGACSGVECKDGLRCECRGDNAGLISESGGSDIKVEEDTI